MQPYRLKTLACTFGKTSPKMTHPINIIGMFLYMPSHILILTHDNTLPDPTNTTNDIEWFSLFKMMCCMETRTFKEFIYHCFSLSFPSKDQLKHDSGYSFTSVLFSIETATVSIDPKPKIQSWTNPLQLSQLWRKQNTRPKPPLRRLRAIGGPLPMMVSCPVT